MKVLRCPVDEEIMYVDDMIQAAMCPSCGQRMEFERMVEEVEEE